MLTNAIQRFLEQKPFIPFTISLTSRTTVRIARANQATINSTGEVLRVFDEEGRESLISIRHVVCLMMEPPADEPVVTK